MTKGVKKVKEEDIKKDTDESVNKEDINNIKLDESLEW